MSAFAVVALRFFFFAFLLLLSSPVFANWGAAQDQQAVSACKLDLPHDVVRYCPCIQSKLEAMNTGGRVLTPDDRTQRLKTAIASCSNDALSGASSSDDK